MKFFRTLWIIDSIVALITVYFFFTGLADGSVSSFNGGLWFGLLLALAAVLCGSMYLKNKGRLLPAKIILSLLAVPAVLFALFMLIAIFSGVRWN